jgi:hypothetical protein
MSLIICAACSSSATPTSDLALIQTIQALQRQGIRDD